MVIEKEFKEQTQIYRLYGKVALIFVTILLISRKILLSMRHLNENIPQNAQTCCQLIVGYFL